MKIRLPGNLFCCFLAIFLSFFFINANSQGVYRFWGLTRQGGQNNTGVLFSLDSNGTHYTMRHDFTLTNAGAAPYYTQLTEWNNKYYGMTIAGGDNNNYGVIFEWDPAENTYTKKFDFAGDDAWFAYGSLTILGNKFYGMTNRGGDFGLGVIFEWDPVTNIFTKVFHFDDASGHSPEGSLVVKNGKLYGMTRAGGDNFGGVIFAFDPTTTTYQKKIDLDFPTGKGPYGQLTWADGRFFGMTAEGGQHGFGVIFEWDPSNNQYQKRYDFDGANGKYPFGSLTVFQDRLYGLTTEGGSNNVGVLFEFNPTGFACTRKLDFGGANGMHPYGNLTAGDQTLGGMTWMGGAGNFGTLFEYDPVANNIIQSREFGNSLLGANPLGSLTWSGSHFYGLTTGGGAANSGVIFEWTPSTNMYERKIDFNVAVNGALPEGNLLEFAGKLYGTTSKGGAANMGVLFSYDERTQIFTRLFDFEGSNGAMPTGDLIALEGKIYGWTREGGDNNRGAIFEWNPLTQTQQLLYSFNYATGAYPSRAPLLRNGKFIGTTTDGGDNGYGVLYEFDPTALNYQKKFDFNEPDGASPTGYLVERNNVLYGMTTYGGANGTGTIYQWEPVGNIFTHRYDFEVSGMGVHPRAGLTLSEDGTMFYGMTRETNGNISFPGQEGPGIIFEWNPSNSTFTPKINFDGSNGGLPVGNLSYGNGKYYGMTSQGGNGESYPGINFIVGGSGVVFEWDAVNNSITKKVDLLGDNGAYPSTNNLGLTKVPVAKGIANSCQLLPGVVIDDTNNNKWVAITDEDGNVVAEINANGNNLGNVSSSIYIHSGNVREDNRRRLYLDRSITIEPSIQPTGPVSLRLYLSNQEWNALKSASNSLGQPSGLNQIGDLAIFKLNVQCGEPITELVNRQTSIAGDWSIDYVLTTTVSSFSTFYFASGNAAEAPLPVEFVDFTAELVQQDALLNWKTSHEEGILRFDIERSTDGVNYEIIGNTNASNTSGVHEYQFVDAKVTTLGLTKAYYRINEVDIDGRKTYSKAVLLNLPAFPAQIVFYPNPVQLQGQLKLQINQAEKLTIRLLDHSGRLLRNYTIQANTGTSYWPIDLTGFAKGVYLLEVRGPSLKKEVRLLKQ